MATTKFILSQIKIEGVLRDLISKSDGENVTVTYNGKDETLSAALAEILASITSLPTSENVQQAINTAISNLVDGAPETADTLVELFNLIESNTDAVTLLNDAILTKVDKVDGKGLSTEDFTTALKNKLESLPVISDADVTNWNNKAEKAVATSTDDGLMSSADKVKLDGVEEGANKYVLPTATNGTVGGVTTTPTVTSADGYTPTPIIDGVPYYTDTKYADATQSEAGLMSASDKTKLDNLRGVRYGETVPSDLADGEIFVQVVSTD